MSGFFSNDVLKSAKRISSITGCGSCGLHKKCENPKLPPAGQGEKGILIIGNSTPKKSDDCGDALSGGSSLLFLKKSLRRYGIDLERDCIYINAVACYSEEEITDYQIGLCRPFVINTIKKHSPKLILAIGENSVISLVGHRFHKTIGGITKWRGWTIPDRDFKCWICPLMTPDHVILQSEKNVSFETVFKKDLQRALSKLNVPLPYYPPEKDCIEVLEGKALYSYLQRLSKSEVSEVAFDYETTGIKPHKEGHRIVSCAFAESSAGAVSFLIPKDPPTLNLLKRVLSNPVIPKIAQNMKFEDIWTYFYFGVHVQGWKWDTMLASHMLDNRKGVTGLKFQAYVRFGIADYDSEVSEYLKGVDEKDANSFNRILEAPVKPLLRYNAMDALLEYRLYQEQRGELSL